MINEMIAMETTVTVSENETVTLKDESAGVNNLISGLTLNLPGVGVSMKTAGLTNIV